MDTTTAQAIHDLATTGRLSEDSTAAVADVLGLDVPDDDEIEPENKSAPAKPAGASKGSAR
jgi:hypothetical protein